MRTKLQQKDNLIKVDNKWKQKKMDTHYKPRKVHVDRVCFSTLRLLWTTVNAFLALYYLFIVRDLFVGICREVI